MAAAELAIGREGPREQKHDPRADALSRLH